MHKIDWSKIRKIYFIGIKGSGMIALVEYFHLAGKLIAGSDVKEKFFTDEILERLEIKVHEGFSRDNLNSEAGIDLVIYSTAYNPENNIEVKSAQEMEFVCLSYPEAVGQLMLDKFSIAVCGTHGKTTTTAMLALAMKEAGADPSAIIGSKITQLGSSGLAGQSQYLIVEADEYQNKFLHYNPMGMILTSVDYDHPDYFATYEDYKKTFKDFVKKIPAHGFLVVWGGSVDTLEIAKAAKCRVIVYGFFKTGDNSKELPITNYQFPNNDQSLISNDLNHYEIERIRDEFKVAGKDNIEFVSVPDDLKLQIPGRHNLLNATAVIACSREFKLDENKVLEALKSYQGTARRFERLGSCNGAEIIDDYAHHPEEIRATLSAARERYPEKNIICVFHPHTFTRTKALLDEFSQSFADANEVIVLDIYGSAREKQGDVHAKDLVEKIKYYKQNAQYISTMDEVYDEIHYRLGENDVVITMGAGNVNELGKKLVAS